LLALFFFFLKPFVPKADAKVRRIFLISQIKFQSFFSKLFFFALPLFSSEAEGKGSKLICFQPNKNEVFFHPFLTSQNFNLFALFEHRLRSNGMQK